MFGRNLSGGLAAAAAGAVMLAATLAPASALTLASPMATSGHVEQVVWKGKPAGGWGNGESARWHGWHWHRHCWRGRWGHLHCRAW